MNLTVTIIAQGNRKGEKNITAELKNKSSPLLQNSDSIIIVDLIKLLRLRLLQCNDNSVNYESVMT